MFLIKMVLFNWVSGQFIGAFYRQSASYASQEIELLKTETVFLPLIDIEIMFFCCLTIYDLIIA